MRPRGDASVPRYSTRPHDRGELVLGKDGFVCFAQRSRYSNVCRHGAKRTIPSLKLSSSRALSSGLWSHFMGPH